MFDAIHLFREALEKMNIRPEVIIVDEHSKLINLPLTPDELAEMSTYDAEGRAAAREMEAGQEGCEQHVYRIK